MEPVKRSSGKRSGRLGGTKMLKVRRSKGKGKEWNELKAGTERGREGEKDGIFIDEYRLNIIIGAGMPFSNSRIREEIVSK